MKLAQHTGEWYSLTTLRQLGRIVDLEKEEIRPATKRDLKEGCPVILNTQVLVVFLYDHINLRYFCETAFESTEKKELVNAFLALKEARV
jgi:hypothetical protein